VSPGRVYEGERTEFFTAVGIIFVEFFVIQCRQRLDSLREYVEVELVR